MNNSSSRYHKPVHVCSCGRVELDAPFSHAGQLYRPRPFAEVDIMSDKHKQWVEYFKYSWEALIFSQNAQESC